MTTPTLKQWSAPKLTIENFAQYLGCQSNLLQFNNIINFGTCLPNFLSPLKEQICEQIYDVEAEFEENEKFLRTKIAGRVEKPRSHLFYWKESFNVGE